MVNIVLSFCAGLTFAAFLVGFFPGKNFEDMQKAIYECEKSLPRDINCIVSAKPMKENN